MIIFVGTTFGSKDPFGSQEAYIIDSIKKQINQRWPNDQNLLVNLTWFGPQFANAHWETMQKFISEQTKFDRVFWLCAIDPLCLTIEKFKELQNSINSQKHYNIGVGFDSELTFNTHAFVILEDFKSYTSQQLELIEVKYPFVNYNRKPKAHRIQLAEKLQSLNGIVTLGLNDNDYDVSDGIKTDLFLSIEDHNDYTHNGKFAPQTNFGGVPYDLCSLGRLDIWQQHFLNIISETVFYPWDTTFVTEKTWKPIIGMRPFVINGQTQIYQWLRDRGFKTFNHYWEHIPIETANDSNIHDMLFDVASYVCSQTPAQLKETWINMMPLLEHNQRRFWEFAEEQKYKIDNLF